MSDTSRVGPATLFPVIDDCLAHVVVGADLLLNVALRDAMPDGNDAGEKFTDGAVHFECFDSDFNVLGTIARVRPGIQVCHLLPTMVEQAKLLFPHHVQADRLAKE